MSINVYFRLYAQTESGKRKKKNNPTDCLTVVATVKCGPEKRKKKLFLHSFEWTQNISAYF